MKNYIRGMLLACALLAIAVTVGVLAPVSRSAAPAASPVGTWNTDGLIYVWSAMPKGFEAVSMTPHKIHSNGCLIGKGEAVEHYYPKGNNIYRVAYQYWYPNKGGAGKAGLRCTKHWKNTEAKVRIIVSSTKMTVSCDNKIGKVCTKFRRVA